MEIQKEIHEEQLTIAGKALTHITIGSQLEYSSYLQTPCSLAFVSDQTVAAAVQERIVKTLTHKNCTHIVIPEGEAAKSRETKAYIEDELIRHSFSRDTMLVASGGGAALDVAGFAAATFCRGIPLVYIPTTLLAMVDAAIGGKNAINIQGVKNCIGTIHHPKQVLIDIEFLKTLPDFQIQCGMVEALKHALLTGMEAVDTFFAKRQMMDILGIITDSVHFKCRLIERSHAHPKMRDLLNFGHTIGHAIEYLEGPQCPHGIAVARGMVAECAIALQRQLLSQNSYEAIIAAIEKLGLPMKNSARYPMALWQKALARDKKTEGGVPHAVLLQDIGRPYEKNGLWSHPLTTDDIEVAIERIS